MSNIVIYHYHHLMSNYRYPSVNQQMNMDAWKFVRFLFGVGISGLFSRAKWLTKATSCLVPLRTLSSEVPDTPWMVKGGEGGDSRKPLRNVGNHCEVLEFLGFPRVFLWFS